jgi:RNA polymerase sigma factor (sigma-70 family)
MSSVAAVATGPHTSRAMSASTGATDDTTDEALMLAYVAGDASAFDTLYARHRGGLYRYFLRHLRNAGAADESFQDVWMNVIRVRERYVPTAKFSTWLYTLAHNRMVDYWRAGARATVVSIDDDGDVAARGEAEAISATRTDEPETRAASREIGACIAAALASLPAEQREAFLLQYEGGHSLAEIAAITGVGDETVKSRLRYATSKLRAVLKDLQ